ncbi:MAG: histidine kinase [Lewinellaceae bacterium]|nr:histidine kinase [Lewinellaceae bacterium]
MELPKYTGKDYYVLSLILFPVSVVMSYAAMGNALFGGFRVFLAATLLSAAVLGVYFTACGWWAVAMKQRFPREADTGRKLFFMIAAFLVLSGLVLLLIFNLFERIPFFHYRMSQGRFAWAYLGLGFVNIFLSFLFEGISRFEAWKANLERKEQLERNFRQSQLQALRSQADPHFLFNSLNALSCLIEEDPEEAERFLDELSKVYRYMLRPETEQLAPLRSEIQFMESYFYLLRARFGESLRAHIDIDPGSLGCLLPALALQAAVEDAVSSNAMSREQPLAMEIKAGRDGVLLVRHPIHPKAGNGKPGQGGRLDLLARKYRLLRQPEISVQEEEGMRTISIPLIYNTGPVWK